MSIYIDDSLLNRFTDQDVHIYSITSVTAMTSEN